MKKIIQVFVVYDTYDKLINAEIYGFEVWSFNVLNNVKALSWFYLWTLYVLYLSCRYLTLLGMF